MRLKKCRRVFSFALCAFLLLQVCAQAALVYADVNKLSVYQSAKTNSRILGNVGYGFSMELLATNGGWARVQNDAGAIGYCALDSLTALNPNQYEKKMFFCFTQIN